MYLNKAIIIGNLTRDPETKALPSGVSVTSFSLATNNTYNDKDGNKQEDVEYHNVVVFGKQAESAGQYLKKGQSALIEGRIQTRSWEQDGVKKYRTEVIADRVQFGAKAGNATAPTQTDAPPTQVAPEESSQIEYPTEEINPDDIPF